MIEHDLEHEKEHEHRAGERIANRQIPARAYPVRFAAGALRNETRRALGELVQRNRERGVTDEMLKDKEKELVEGAAGLAAHRLKTNFILHRIAEREKIQVTREDVEARHSEEAARYNISVEKMRKELEQHDGLNALRNRFCWVRLLISLRRMLASKPAQEPAVKEEKS